MMTPAEENRVCELTEEIVRLKKHLTENSARMTNADAFDKLEKIGELLSEKNALTGLHEDAAYLYLDDGEWFREVKGFVGDDSGMHDCTGTTLKIGDTVCQPVKNHAGYHRSVPAGKETKTGAQQQRGRDDGISTKSPHTNPH